MKFNKGSELVDLSLKSLDREDLDVSMTWSSTIVVLEITKC